VQFVVDILEVDTLVVGILVVGILEEENILGVGILVVEH